MHLRKISYYVLLIVVLISGMAGCSTSTSGSKAAPTKLEDFKIGYLASPGQSLYFVAQEEGFFKKEGINAQLVRFTNSGEGINSVISGKLDTGSFGTAAPLTFLEKNADITMFAGTMGTGAALVAKAENADKYKDLKNLKGKKVGTVRLATGDAIIRSALTKSGLDIKKDVEITELDSPKAVVEALKKGSLDAGVVWTPYIELATQQGLGIVTYTKDLFADHPCCRMVAKTEFTKDKPDTYVKVLKALLLAEKFKEANKDKTVADVAKYVQVDAATLKNDIYGGYQITSVDPNQAGVYQFAQEMAKIGYIKDPNLIKQHFNTDLYSTALNQLSKENPNDPFFAEAQQRFKKSNNL